MMMTNEELNELKTFLKEYKLKKTEVAKELGITLKTLNARLDEKAQFTREDLAKLLSLGVSFDTIQRRIQRLYDEKGIEEKYQKGEEIWQTSLLF